MMHVAAETWSQTASCESEKQQILFAKEAEPQTTAEAEETPTTRLERQCEAARTRYEHCMLARGLLGKTTPRHRNHATLGRVVLLGRTRRFAELSTEQARDKRHPGGH